MTETDQYERLQTLIGTEVHQILKRLTAVTAYGNTEFPQLCFREETFLFLVTAHQ